MPKEGVEPSPTCVERCLRPQRLPFRHFGPVSVRHPTDPAGHSVMSLPFQGHDRLVQASDANSGQAPLPACAVCAGMSSGLRSTQPCRQRASRRCGPRDHGPNGRRSERPEPRAAGPRLATDARLPPPHVSQHRRPEGPPDRGGPSLDDGPRRPRPAPRSHPHRACPVRGPRRVQRPRHAVPGLVVRSGRPDGARSRPGRRRRPGGVLLGLSEPRLVPWREREVVAQPDLRQRRDGHPAREEASTGAALSRARGRELAAEGRRRASIPSGSRSTPSAAARSPRRWPTSPTTSEPRSSCTTSRATTTARSPR